MSYACKVLADTISPRGHRLTTVEVTFPRFILAEVNTHRMLSRNSASSRAIPTEKIIEKVMAEPFIPETFNSRVKGMGVGDTLEPHAQEECKRLWIEARDCAVAQAKGLIRYDVDKSRVNRLLEPFMWHTAIITATEWDNFFALRDHPHAQPEFQIVARLMLDKMRDSLPKQLVSLNEWHVPLVTEDEQRDLIAESGYAWTEVAMISAGRCARVSFDRAGEFEPYQESFDRAKRLLENGHLSPMEHAAVPLGEVSYEVNPFCGNFAGWRQLRKTIADEANLVGHIERRPPWDRG